MTEPQDRRELIVTSAAALFARQGIATTTVREIAKEVGVLSGSLYHHFASKDAIVIEVLSGYLDTIRDRYAQVLASGSSSPERLRELVLVSLRIAEEQPNPTAIYQNELHYLREQPYFDSLQKAAADVQRAWLQVIEAGVADGSFRDDIPPRVFYRVIRDAVWLSGRRHRPTDSYTTEQLADDVTSILLNGYKAR
jgi:AcrR family transcriptional regulator